MRIVRRFTIVSLIMLFALTPLQGIFADHITHHFPRKANVFFAWTLSEEEARQLARWDVVVLDMEVQIKNPKELALLRKLNPDIIILAYITSQEIRKDANNSFSTMRKRLESGIHDEWYLQDDAGKRLGWWPGTWLLNVTNDAPRKGGERWNSYLVDFMIDEVLSTGYWDGIFYDNAWDNVTYFIGDNVDTNLDRRIDVKTSADAAWREGMKYIYNETRRRTNDRYIIVGNGTTREYSDELNGKLLENFLSFSWEPTLTTYRNNHNNDHTPKVNIINANTNNGAISRENYRHFRFGLTSSLLEDGYYSFDYGDQNHGQVWWYDEYDADLGNALGDARGRNGEAHYQRSVWQRDFERGLAVVNSTGEKAHVTLDGEYEKIRGTQDPISNDGRIITELTLGAEDGRVLLKTFSTLDQVLYTNGSFVRFFRPNGERVRNGFFTFDPAYAGGDQIAKINLDGKGDDDLFLVSGNKIQAWRHDDTRFFKQYPFSARSTITMRAAIGDVDGDGRMDIVTAPAPGQKSPEPIKVYNLSGNKLIDQWYPFGQGYIGGYSIAVAQDEDGNGRIVVGAGQGREPEVRMYDKNKKEIKRWYAYERAFRGGVNVAAGDLDGDGEDEVVTGPGFGGKPWVKVFSLDGVFNQQSNFQAYNSFGFPGIDVRVVDVDFDGKEDIVAMSDGAL